MTSNSPPKQFIPFDPQSIHSDPQIIHLNDITSDPKYYSKGRIIKIKSSIPISIEYFIFNAYKDGIRDYKRNITVSNFNRVGNKGFYFNTVNDNEFLINFENLSKMNFNYNGYNFIITLGSGTNIYIIRDNLIYYIDKDT